MFGKLFGRGKPKRDAFGVETSTTTVGVPDGDTTTTVTTTTSETRSLGGIDLFGSQAAAGLDLGALLSTVREAQQQSGGDHEAMAKLLRERLGSDAVIVDQPGGDAADWTVVPQDQQPDPIALLATLTELHEKGVVSDEQFEEQKRRLLG